MGKFIFLADTHIKGINPINRIGNYYQDVMAKIKEVISIAKEKKVDAIVHCGDLYDSPTVSNVMVDEFIDIVELAGIQWHIVPGNHDEIGHNWELSKGSSLAHIFRRSKLIHKLDSILNKDSKASFIQGFPYYHNVEQAIKENGLYANIDKNFKGLKIAVTHAMIVFQTLPFQVMHILAKNMKTNFNIIICSHYHKGCDIKEVNGVKFLKLCSIGRTGIDEAKIIPTMSYIDTLTQEIEFIPLKSAKKGSEVFDLKKVEEIKQFEKEITNFINSLSDVKIQGLDIRGMVEYIAKEKNVEQEITKEVIRRIGGFEQ